MYYFNEFINKQYVAKDILWLIYMRSKKIQKGGNFESGFGFGMLIMCGITILIILMFSAFTRTSNNSSNPKTTSYSLFDMFYPRKDVLLNPYDPPLKDESSYMVPINVSTNIGATNTGYQQLGIITPTNASTKDNILPLMGKQLFTSRDKWNYYTISNQHNNVKLPISFKGKSALSEYGVDKIYNGDTVYVEGYNEAFKATIYENDTLRYLPIL